MAVTALIIAHVLSRVGVSNASLLSCQAGRSQVDALAHCFQGPMGPTPPAFGHDFFHPPRNTCTGVGSYQLSIAAGIQSRTDAAMDDLEGRGVARLGCKKAYDRLYLLWGEHSGQR